MNNEMCTATEELEKETIKKKDGKNEEDNSEIDVIPRKDTVQAKSPV